MPIRSALLTGATGFVGGHLARRLVDAGSEVHVVVRPTSDVRGTLGPLAARLHIHEYRGTAASMAGIVRAASPGAVFHVAATGGATHLPAELDALVDANLLLGLHLLEALRQESPVPFVNTGTHWQYYAGRERHPVSLYAACKQAFQDLLAYYCEAEGFQAITLVLYDTYGEGDRRRRLFGLLGDAARRGAALDMTPGEQRISLVHVDDVATAYLTAADHLAVRTGEAAGHAVYCVRPGAPVTLRDVVQLYGEVTGKPVQVNWGALPYRPREIMEPWAGGTTLPGWAPCIGLREGIRRLAHD